MERKNTTRQRNRATPAVDKHAKKSLGRYYTDPAIADFIVSKLETISEDKTALDPACGVGEFLVSFSKALVATMRARGASEPGLHAKIASNVWGFDIDAAAVKSCTTRLVRDGFMKEGQGHHVYNIDALDVHVDASTSEASRIDDSIYTRKFDYIIGNPPFFVVDKEKRPYCSVLGLDVYKAIDTDNLNVASMFLYRFMHSLRPNGQLAFIFPRSLLHVSSFASLRREILEAKVQFLFDLGKAFDEVGLEQCIIIIKNASNDGNVVHYALLGNEDERIVETVSYDIPQDYLASTTDNVFEVFSGKKTGWMTTWAALKGRIEAQAAGNDIMRYCTEIQRGIGLQREANSTRKAPNDIIVAGGRSIFNYGKKGAETCRYLDEGRIIKEKMAGKDRANLHSPKVMLQNLVSSKIRIVGCYDNVVNRAGNGYEKDRYTMTFDTITNLYLRDQRYARFLLAILTSELVTCFLRDVVFVRATLTIHLDKKYLAKIPIPQPTDAQLAGITSIVEDLERYAREHQWKEPVRERDVPDWEDPTHPDHHEYERLTSALNEFVYDIYGTTSLERQFIAGQLKEFDEFF